MKILSNNRRARFEYEILEEFEAGLVLVGTEVKSIKEGKVNIREAYIEIRDGEAFITGMHVAPFREGNLRNVDPYRERKLLLNRREINKLYKEVTQAGLTIVPLRLYRNNKGLVKIEIALARGKKLYDKREAQKEKDLKRQMERYQI
ncbi:MAG TPA: SsrA-binding protein SmpB [Clostridia bacterium]|nr:SsrA-binding protein SmpB [Clostridia bacterium]